MRLLPLLCALLAVGGCDAFSDSAADFMSDLDGTWSRTITSETIAADGTLSPGDATQTDVYEVGRVVRCATRDFESAGDSDRIAAAYTEAFPNSRTCSVLSVDADARRIILVGSTADVNIDNAGTIDEASTKRMVWRFYAPAADGSAVRTVWTLTRS